MPDLHVGSHRGRFAAIGGHRRSRRSGCLDHASEVIVPWVATCTDPVFLGRSWGRPRVVASLACRCAASPDPLRGPVTSGTRTAVYMYTGIYVRHDGRVHIKPTPQVLDVLETLTKATTPIHGWEIARRAGQEPATVYRILERLRDASWVTREWEPDTGAGARRRLYELTATGRDGARELLDRRKGKLQ